MSKRIIVQKREALLTIAAAPRILALAFFVLAQTLFVAHASGGANAQDHDVNACEICHLVERDDDTLPPAGFPELANADIASPSIASANEAPIAKIIRSADSRAPPSLS